jgi:glutamine amidotransferase
MTTNVAIINYGLGNIRSLFNCLKKIDANPQIINSPQELKKFNKIILPGVGSYKDAMKLIKKFGWDEGISDYLINRENQLFGICVGMQILSSFGLEYGKTQGLDIIDGEVQDLAKFGCKLKLPHIGWNDIQLENKSYITKGISNNSCFYFVNGYAFNLKNKNNLIATVNYDIKFPAIIEKDNVVGTQFHPEKSSKAGYQILKNFLNA